MTDEKDVFKAMQVLRDYCEEHRAEKEYDGYYDDRGCRDDPYGEPKEDAPCNYKKCLFWCKPLEKCYFELSEVPPEQWALIEDDEDE